ncbi:hypothetical protein [Rhodovarius sp.]|uniref:hypothetical protein n=1 Tax=Rhodovarius sp. TaxID=2972673 RepID=UPI00334070A0
MIIRNGRLGHAGEVWAWLADVAAREASIALRRVNMVVPPVLIQGYESVAVMQRALNRVPQLPKPLMRLDQAVHIAPAIGAGIDLLAGEHHFQCPQQLVSHLIISLITGLVEGGQDFVRQTHITEWKKPIHAVAKAGSQMIVTVHAQPHCHAENATGQYIIGN